MEECPFTHEHEGKLERMQSDIDSIKARVYNGLGNELRSEVGKELAHNRGLVVGILVSLILSFAGIIVQGRIASNSASHENDRNYMAIMELKEKLDIHLSQGANP